MKKLWDFIATDARMIFLVFSSDGYVTMANIYTHNVIGNKIIGMHFNEIFLDFDDSVNLEILLQKEENKMLNINTLDGLPQSYYFKFMADGDRRIAIGENDPAEYSILRREMLNMNNELNTLTRTLHKKNAELEKLNDLKNQFLGVAAHDLRNPIGNIIRLSEFLLSEAREKLSDNHVKFLQLIKKLGEYGMGLLDDLLDIVKIESGKLSLRLKPTDTIALIKDIIELNNLNAITKGSHINLLYYAPVPHMMADQSSFRQILDNLLSNAIKYSSAGSIIEVGILENKSFITIFVKDQGQGISKEDQKKIFKPFGKAGSKATGGEKSTGLGLSIVQKLVIGHGGKIWLDSNPGKGSTFYFSIPVATEKTDVI